jgi:hypothetical protein
MEFVWFMQCINQVQNQLKGIVSFVSYGASSESAWGVCVVHAHCKASSEPAQGFVWFMHIVKKVQNQLKGICGLWVMEKVQNQLERCMRFMRIVKQVQNQLKGIVWFVSYGASS